MFAEVSANQAARSGGGNSDKPRDFFFNLQDPPGKVRYLLGESDVLQQSLPFRSLACGPLPCLTLSLIWTSTWTSRKSGETAVFWLLTYDIGNVAQSWHDHQTVIQIVT